MNVCICMQAKHILPAEGPGHGDQIMGVGGQKQPREPETPTKQPHAIQQQPMEPETTTKQPHTHPLMHACMYIALAIIYVRKYPQARRYPHTHILYIYIYIYV